MLTLHGFGPAFGLPDLSPFVVKSEVLLKLADLDYRKKPADPRKGPKGKMPWLDDGGRVVADSTLIRFHLETTRGIDFERGLDDRQKGAAWALEKMLEDQVYWLMIMERWHDPINAAKVQDLVFAPVPALMRPLVLAMVRRQSNRTLHGQGIGRLALDERAMLARRAALAVSQTIGEGPWLMGDQPCGADATVFAFAASAMCPHFNGPVRDAFAAHANLSAYVSRGTARWFAGAASEARDAT